MSTSDISPVIHDAASPGVFPPFTTASFKSLPAGQTKQLLTGASTQFIFALWISISAASGPVFAVGSIIPLGCEIRNAANGQSLLRVDVHLVGPEHNASNSETLFLGGLAMNPPYDLEVVTDAGAAHTYFSANGGIYYAPASQLCRAAGPETSIRFT